MLSDYTLNKETPVPLYFQLKTLILERIKDGTYRPGDLIPTENELSAMFNISRTTVRQAVTELVRDGYLYRIKSKGTFVSKPKINQRVLSRYFSHDDAIRGAGRNMKMEILKKEVIIAPQFLVDMGLCQAGEKVIYLYRRRIVDGEPMARTISYMSYEKFTDFMELELENYSLRELMAQMPKRWFCAPHQSYLVNLLHIRTASAQEVCMMDGTRIPITRGRQREFLQSFHRFLGV